MKAAIRSVREDVMAAIRKSNKKRDAQHAELLAMIRALQGPTSQSRTDVPPSDDRSFDDHGGAFSPPDRTGAGQDRTDLGSRQGPPSNTGGHTGDRGSVDQQGHGPTDQGEVPGGSETVVLEEVPLPVLDDSVVGTEPALLDGG